MKKKSKNKSTREDDFEFNMYLAKKYAWPTGIFSEKRRERIRESLKYLK